MQKATTLASLPVFYDKSEGTEKAPDPTKPTPDVLHSLMNDVDLLIFCWSSLELTVSMKLLGPYQMAKKLDGSRFCIGLCSSVL